MTITATYSPEDNKLRLYASTRLDAETYGRVRNAGFIWAPKQELFVAPSWSPAREDLCIELAGEIEPEEMTLAERAQLKAERLEGIAHRRNKQANAFHARANDLSEAFYMGQPILVGHHSERKARKTQERMHSAMKAAVEASKAANYWLYRATSVEHHANYKNLPSVRANRIKTLLADLRDIQRDINHAHNVLRLWSKITTEEQIAKLLHMGVISTGRIFRWDTWGKVEKGEMTLAQAREESEEDSRAVVNSATKRRWIEHVLNRLGYEYEMHGAVARYEGELTSVVLQAFARTHGAHKPVATKLADGSFLLKSPVRLPLHIGTSEELELTADEWRDLMQSSGYTVPAPVERKKSAKPAPAPLINPTQEQAEQLQRIWNLHMIAACNEHQKPLGNAVREMTQATFSANSKGEYAHLKTVEIDAEGRIIRGVWRNHQFVQSAEPIARIRMAANGATYYKPNAVIRLTDKPGKSLPIDLVAIEAKARQAVEEKKDVAA